MGARYFSTPIYNAADTTTVRAMGSELNSEMLAAGCTQAADTGQVDWTTVTYTGSNQVLGYEIWNIVGGALRLKITYQTGSSVNACLRTTIVIGTGSDGAGNITGTIFTSITVTNNNGASAGNKPSFISETADFFGLVWKFGGPTSGGGYTPSLQAFTVEKIVGADGLPDGTGYKILHMHTAAQTSGASGGNTSGTVYVDVGGGVYTANGTIFCLVPLNTTNSNVGTDRQVFLHQFPTPRTKFGHGVCTVIEAEFPINTTFSAALIGATPRNYISVGFAFGITNAAGGAVRTWSAAMIWEP
jgi:hypothetical protein